MTADTSAFCVIVLSKFLRSFVLGLRAFLIGIILVLGGPTGFGLCGPTGVGAWSLGDCTVLLHRTRLLLELPWALLSTAWVASCVRW